MTTSWSLQNSPSETPFSLLLVPFDKTAWAEVSREFSAGSTTIESRVAGETPSFPLIRRVVNRPAQVFHPAEGANKKRSGRVFRVEIYSNVAVEDTVLGPMTPEIIQTAVEIKYTGNTIPDQRDVLLMLASTLCEMFTDAPSGVPGFTIIDRVAVGVVDID